MPSLKDTKRRILSVKNTQKITHAMKLVSAAKFARANQAALAARPYGQSFERLVCKLAKLANEKGVQNDLLKKEAKTNRELIVVVSTDRGLCGSLNSNLFKTVLKFYKERQAENVAIDFACWGRRATSLGRKLKVKIVDEREKVADKPKYESSVNLAHNLVKWYRGVNESGYDAVHLAFVEFKSAMSQTPRIKQLLPIGIDTSSTQSGSDLDTDALVEPGLEALLDTLLSRFVSVSVFRSLLEGYASEQGARMSAMENATKNAKEVIRKLTLQYNRARQAAITKELIEITSGAQAL